MSTPAQNIRKKFRLKKGGVVTVTEQTAADAGLLTDAAREAMGDDPALSTEPVIPETPPSLSPPVAPTPSVTASTRPKSNRGRKKGGHNKPKASTVREQSEPTPRRAKANAAGGAQLLMIVHGVLAAAVKAPELNLEPNEAELYANALENWSREFNVALSGKAQATISLGLVMAGIYGPRVAAISARRPKKASKGKPAGNGASNPGGAAGNGPDWNEAILNSQLPPVAA